MPQKYKKMRHKKILYTLKKVAPCVARGNYLLYDIGNAIRP